MLVRATIYMAFALAPVSAALADETCPMTYEQFEFAVPHVDMETCPGTIATEATFCRASTAADQIHVFQFKEDGDQCLLTVVSVDEDGYSLTIN